MFERLMPLIGEDKLKKIQNTKVLLVGVGGVGGYVLEALARSGFINIAIVDGDTINLSNLNRQIISNESNIGSLKVEEAKKRVLSINKEINIKTIDVFLDKNNFKEYIKEDYDFIIDAIDDVDIKIELIKYAIMKNIKIITCLGTGRKLDPTRLKITKLNKTFNDPLAKKLRYELKKQSIDLNIPVLFSEEVAINTEKIVGSAIFVPAVAGICLANYVFLNIIKEA